ncbi:alpha/beta hydrolase [Tolypothrix sp. NIES-4075]|nr:alpha/beta hydrolase [Tolypothrix sp. NIES-4075]
MGNGEWGIGKNYYQLPITNYQLPITNYQLPMPNAPLKRYYLVN